MARVVGIGHQNFEQLIQSGCFYIDKTRFIREWWENRSEEHTSELQSPS